MEGDQQSEDSQFKHHQLSIEYLLSSTKDEATDLNSSTQSVMSDGGGKGRRAEGFVTCR